MSEKKKLHEQWIEDALAKGYIRFEDANITVKNIPKKGDKTLVPFKKAVFILNTPAEFSDLSEMAEPYRGTVKDDDGNETPDEHPLSKLLTYAYGLNCRSKVRSEFEGKFEDPEKALKNIANSLVKAGKYKSFAKAMAAAKVIMAADVEDDEDEDEQGETEA